MSDQALPESAVLPTLPDASPSSAGHSSPSHGGEQTQAQEVISDELKARLDKVIYSDVSRSTVRCISKQQKELY